MGIGYTFLMEPAYFFSDPFCFRLLSVGKMADHRPPLWQHGNQFLFDAVCILFDQGIGHCQYLGSGTVIFHHEDGLRSGKTPVKVFQVGTVGSPPGVNGLVRVPYHEQVLMVGAQHFHQFVLEDVDILELVDHNIFQPLLPFQPDVFLLPEQIQGEFDQVVVIQPEAFLFLIQVPVKDNLFFISSLVVLLLQGLQRHGQHILIVLRLFKNLLYLDHVPGIGKSHVPQGQSPLFVDDLQHGVYIGIVQDEKAFWIPESVAVFLQNRNAEAVKGIDIPGIIVPGQVVDALPHLAGCFIGKGHAQDISRQDAKFIYQKSKPAGQCPRLSGACPGDDTDKPFRS